MPLHFELVTPAALVRSEDVHSVTVPGSEGDFTVLEGHAPFMSTVKSGDLLITRAVGAEPERVAIEGGFAEVNEAGLTILAEKAG
jgi:F-type H+-transporting ATPase subunit epsilon